MGEGLIDVKINDNFAKFAEVRKFPVVSKNMT